MTSRDEAFLEVWKDLAGDMEQFADQLINFGLAAQEIQHWLEEMSNGMLGRLLPKRRSIMADGEWKPLIRVVD